MSEAMTSSTLFRRLKKLAENDPPVRSLVVLVERVFSDCSNFMKTAVRSMPEYTLHDEVHLERVVELMGRLIPEDTLANLKPLEIAALIFSAALHDVGMAPSATELDAVFKKSNSPEAEALQLAYDAFSEVHPHLLARQRQLRTEQKHAEAQEIEAFFLAAFLRRYHAERGRRFVFERYGQDLRYEHFDFTARLADTCYSHNQDPAAIKVLPCWELVRSPGEYCNWRFVALILRLADILDFDPKRTPAILFEHLGIRTPISIREWKKHQSVKAWDIRPDRIAFTAQCLDPVIEKCVRDFIAWINGELVAAGALLLDFHDPAQPDLQNRYKLGLPVQVDTRGIGPAVGADGPLYDYVDLSFYLDKENIVSLVMGIALYADPILFLRELLQNSVDATRHRLALHQMQPELGDFQPRIVVRLASRNGRELIEVEDNGMGMDSEIVRNYFARVGRSYYKSGRFREERTKANLSFQPVSQFGIGILSVFMVADRMKVDTFRFGQNSRPLSIDIEGEGALFWFRQSQRVAAGTKVSLALKTPSSAILRKEQTSDLKQSPPKPSLFQTVADLAPHIEFPISIEDNGLTNQFTGTWRFPRSTSSEPCISEVHLDLTVDAPLGLHGIAKVCMIEEKGRFKDWAYVEAPSWDDNDDKHDLRNYVELKSGYIEHIHKDRTVKEGISEAYSNEIDSGGRWSQQGFSVPYPLFEEHPLRERREKGPTVGFPFPVLYDLNLSGEFTLPLSADRKSILHTEECAAVCAQIYRVFTDLLFKKLGREKVNANQEFLLKLATEDDRGEILEERLAKFLQL